MGRQLTLPLIDGFKRQWPRTRLAIVEGLSSHIVEWITTGRVDLGLLYNPEAHPGLEITPLLQEPLCVVDARPRPTQGRRLARPGADATLPLAGLAGLPLVLPERAHAIRRLLETQAALAGLKLDTAWEVSSIPAIIDLVCAGYGHAVLTASAVQASGRSAELRVRTLVAPQLITVLCLAASSHKRSTPLAREAGALLQALVRALPHGVERLMRIRIHSHIPSGIAAIESLALSAWVTAARMRRKHRRPTHDPHHRHFLHGHQGLAGRPGRRLPGRNRQRGRHRIGGRCGRGQARGRG